MRRALHIFVHITPPEGGPPHHRRDHEPYAGLAPIQQWRHGEIVRDAVQLDLPPGTWSLRIGLFEGDYRSPAVPETDSPIAIDSDGRIIGPTVTIP